MTDWALNGDWAANGDWAGVSSFPSVSASLSVETNLGGSLDAQVSALISGIDIEVGMSGEMTTPIVPLFSVSASIPLVTDLGGVLYHFGLRDLDVRNLRHPKKWSPVESRRNESSLTHTEKVGRSLEFLDHPGQQPPFAEP